MHHTIYLVSMVKKDLFKSVKIDSKGRVFDLGEIYKHGHDWLDWRKYDVVEKKYVEKVKPDGRELKMKWECTRDIDEYSRFEIDVEWELYGLNDVKMKHEGQDIKLQTGNIVIRVSAILVLDYDGKWETSRVNKFMKSFFEKYLYAGSINQLKTNLWKEGWDYYNEMKAYLDLYQHM